MRTSQVIHCHNAGTRISGRLLRQATASASGAASSGGIVAKVGTFVSESFQQASVLNQAIIVIVMGLSVCMVVFVGLIWVAEYLGSKMSRKAEGTKQAAGLSTPVASPLSVDLESPVKDSSKIDNDEEILNQVSMSNRGVQLIINESTDYSNNMRTIGTQDVRRQLNLKLKASPSLVTSHVLRKSSNFSPRMSGVGVTVRRRSHVSRKGTLGANDHAKIVKPLTATDLTVIDSVKSRDISKDGWAHNPHASRKFSSGVSTPVSVTDVLGDSSFRTLDAASGQHGLRKSILGGGYPTMNSPSTHSSIGDFRLAVGQHALTGGAMTAHEKLAIHNSITASTGLHPPSHLNTAQSIGPTDIKSLCEIEPASDDEPSASPSNSPRCARKDTHLGDLILLDADQFKDEIVLIKLLGTGACGSVHEAIWRGSLVAVKILHPSRQVSQAAVDTFKKEVIFMSGMGDHEGILKVLGACLTAPNLCIITELAEEGSLHSLLHSRCLRPEYKTLLDISYQMASAVAFCHAKNLVHRDLKTHNILIKRDGSAVVADFGLAVNLDTNTMMSGGGTAMGTSSYMAPEQFSAGKLDDKCDSYAFGCILWECITGRQPWEECNNLMQIVMAVGVERRRPPLPKGIPGPLASIIRECWRHNPALRPSMKEIADRLRSLKREEQQALAFKAAAQLATKQPSPRLGTSPHSSPSKKSAQAWNEKWSPVKGTRMAQQHVHV
jgi:hypothetical protein